MEYFGASVIVILFLFLLKLFNLVENSMSVVKISRLALDDIRNPDLSDDKKEEQTQKYAIKLVKLFAILTICSILALGIPISLIWLLDYFAVLSFDNVVEITLSTWFLVVSTFLIAGFFWVTRNRK